MHIASIGIDLGKTTFHLVALGERNIMVRRKFSRGQLLAYTANLPALLIGLEACAGAHSLGAALQEHGHQVRLVPALFRVRLVQALLTLTAFSHSVIELPSRAVTFAHMCFCPVT